MGPRFLALQAALDARRARLQQAAEGLAPEEVLVLEIVGQVEDFIRAVERAGLEWLAEVEVEDMPPDDDFFAVASSGEPRPEKLLRGRMFMVFTNQEALRQMVSLWDAWTAGDALPWGLRKWGRVFEQLHDLRVWGVQDRLLETGVLTDWRERVEHGQEIVPCEIELWFRRTDAQRRRAADHVAALVTAQDGTVVDEAVIEPILYHALLAELPVAGLHGLMEEALQEAELIQCEQIQFFRAAGQMAGVLVGEELEDDALDVDLAEPRGEPIVALLDGLPLQEHHRLQGRLIVDDPDGFEEGYLAEHRRHGTAMASLIIHGDLGGGEAGIARPLYVRPILRPDPRDWITHRESVPSDVLVVDLVHRAVRRLFEAEGDDLPAAPSVAVINLSIGIGDRPFDNALTPLARLLDWLAWRYKALFLVSCGNYGGPLEVSVPQGDFVDQSRQEMQREVVSAIARMTRQRRLLSPSEAVNAITVGASHSDAVADSDLPAGWTDPLLDPRLPSLINAQGMGYRRGIKPDVLAPGGRVLVRESIGGGAGSTELELFGFASPPGNKVATPGHAAGDLDSTRHTRGTSNATALMSRAASMIHTVLEELENDPGGEIIASVPRAIWLKALVIHGADWGAAEPVLETILKNPENSRDFKTYLTRLVGYGSVDPARARECTPFRVTALSGGQLSEDESHVHQYPLPPSLAGHRVPRRLIVTLAWLSPINPRHQAWRRAQLWFRPRNEVLRVDRTQADWQAVQRGTLQHEIMEGERAATFVDGDNLEIRVSCRGDAGALEDPIPYALVTTVEVPEETGIVIYDEVRVRVQERIRVAAQG